MPNEKSETHKEAPAEKQAFLLWAEKHATPDWLLAAAAHKARWPEGQEVSEADYQAALEGASAEAIV